MMSGSFISSGRVRWWWVVGGGGLGLGGSLSGSQALRISFMKSAVWSERFGWRWVGGGGGGGGSRHTAGVTLLRLVRVLITLRSGDVT